MKTIDDFISRCDAIAWKNTYYCNSPSNYATMQRKIISEEHRQIASWLRKLKRAETLLKATYELLKKQDDSYYVKNLLAETIFYDNAECDGSCLMEDIETWIEEENG